MPSEWWQRVWIPTILDFENTYQERVRSVHDSQPHKDSGLLQLPVLDPWDLDSQTDGSESQHTVQASNNLALDAELILEASSEVCDTAFAIARDVRWSTDVVEHVARSEQKDCDDAESSPEIA